MHAVVTARGGLLRQVFLFFGFAAAMLGISTSAQAQDLQAFALATDFSALDTVIELDVPPDLDGVSFIIVWNTGRGQYTSVSYARAGTHCYELRHRPQWKGIVQVVAITLPRTGGRVKKPTLFDEIDMFLEPEQLRPATVNVLLGHTLFAWSWDTFLLLLLLISLLCAVVFAAFRKQRLVPLLAVSFLLCWSLMDLRTIYDHVAMVYKMERYQQGMLPLISLKTFADRASEMIGPATWGHAPIDGIRRSFLEYSLAEHRYVPEGSKTAPALWITQDPKEGQVLFQYANYYLVKRNQP